MAPPPLPQHPQTHELPILTKQHQQLPRLRTWRLLRGSVLDWSRRNDTEGHELDNLEMHVRPFHVEKVDVHEKFDDALSCGRVVVRWCTIRDGEVFAVARAPMIHNSISAQH